MQEDMALMKHSISLKINNKEVVIGIGINNIL